MFSAKTQVGNYSFTYSLTDFVPGVYFVVFYSNKQKFLTHKIIKS